MKGFFPDKLKTARMMRGLSLEALSLKMEGLVTKQALSKYEKGKMQPSETVLQALAEALQLPLGYFLQRSVEVGQINFRTDSRMSARSVGQMVSIAQDLMERYLRLEDSLSLSSSFVNPLRSLRVASSDDVEKAAERLRSKWQLGCFPIFSVYEMLESVGVKLIEFDAGVSHVMGFSTFVNKDIPLVVVNLSANATVERKRFTALHELGHLLLNFASDLDESRCERLCHLFAGAVLCPSSVLYKELGNVRTSLTLNELVSLKNRYGISVSAIVHRAKDLSVISPQYYNDIFNNHIHANPMERGWGGYPIPEHTDRFERLLMRAVAEGYFSVEEAAELANENLNSYRDEINIL